MQEIIMVRSGYLGMRMEKEKGGVEVKRGALRHTRIFNTSPRIGTRSRCEISKKLDIHLNCEPFGDECDAREGGRRGGATMKEDGKTSEAPIRAMRKAGILANGVETFDL